MFGPLMLISCGLLLIAFGFWGGHTFRQPYDVLAAWCAPVGLLVDLYGIVLLFIPNFFA